MLSRRPMLAGLAVVVLCGVAQQIALGTLKFSSPTAEAVFRGPYLLGCVAFALACWRRGGRPTFPGRWLPGLVAAAVTLMLMGALWERDAQGAIFILLLAALQVLAALLILVT